MVNFPHQAYAVLTWTGVGLAIYVYTRPQTDEQLAEKVGDIEIFDTLLTINSGQSTKDAP